MALTCPTGFDAQRLRTEVSGMYSRVAEDPGGEFHFHRGPKYATEFLDYSAAELARLPALATESFAGVGNPHLIGPIRARDTVVDIGCGAGMDVLLAARGAGWVIVSEKIRSQIDLWTA
jgi:arsenite methyltransferase